MKVVILNYDTLDVDVRTLTEKEENKILGQDCDIEDILSDKFGYSLDNINYMCVDDMFSINVF